MKLYLITIAIITYCNISFSQNLQVKTIKLDTISSIEYEFNKSLNFDSLICLNTNKKNGKIELLLDNNKKIKLKDRYPNSDNVNQKIYTYYGYSEKLSSYFIIESLYETGNNLLINKKTGVKKIIYGKPIISPDFKYFLSFQGDLAYDLIENGIQLWKINNDDYSKIWEMKLIDWQVIDIKWINTYTILVKEINLNKEEKYLKITFN
jgi:hypothetical protein